MNSPRIPPFPFFSLATVSHSQRRRRSGRSLRRRGHLELKSWGRKGREKGKPSQTRKNELHLFNKLYQVYREVASEVAFFSLTVLHKNIFVLPLNQNPIAKNIFLSASQIPNRNLVGKVPLLIRLGWGSAQSRCFAPAARRRHSALLPLQL